VIALFGSVLVMSLVGSLHCAAMCGGLVGFVVGHGGRTLVAQAMYQLGRWLAYASLGLASGFVGQKLDVLGRQGGLAHAATLLAAVLMVLWGASRLMRSRTAELKSLTAKKRTFGPRWFTALMVRTSELSPKRRAATLGLLSGLLPCSWLYAFVLMAAGTGDAASGVVVMTAFWLGGVPALLGVSVIFDRGLRLLGKRAPVVMSTLIMVAGLGTLATRALATSDHGDSTAPESCPLHGSMGASSEPRR
jgi:uncharacterized protein